MSEPRVMRSFRLPPELIERYESRAKKLGMDRTMFVIRALEAALGGAAVVDGPRSAAGRADVSAASPRAPESGLSRADAFRAAQARRR